MAGPAIELSGVEKHYAGHAALAGVSLSVEKGAFSNSAFESNTPRTFARPSE